MTNGNGGGIQRWGTNAAVGGFALAVIIQSSVVFYKAGAFEERLESITSYGAPPTATRLSTLENRVSVLELQLTAIKEQNAQILANQIKSQDKLDALLKRP